MKHVKNDQHESIDRALDLIKDAGYTPIPNFVLTPEYVHAVGADGVLLIACLMRAYDLGHFRHKLRGGQLALPDQHLAAWWGQNTTNGVRKARKKVATASPAFLAKQREGCTGRPYEYEIRRLTKSEAVQTSSLRQECFGMPTRKRKAHRSASLESRIRESALKFVDQGWSVIPVNADKAPAISSWKKYQVEPPTRDDVTRWFATPGRNIGLITGAVSGLVVVDLDGDYQALLNELSCRGIHIPRTTSVRTARGMHYWFSHPGKSVGTVAGILKSAHGSIDIRGDGGCIVAPPSLHRSGTTYSFVQEVDPNQLPVLPAGFIDLIENRGSAGRSSGPWRPVQVEAARSADLVDVMTALGVAVSADGAGRYKAVCPFHNDHNASLKFEKSGGRWKCYGCNEAGDAIDFVSRMRRISFSDAVDFLTSGSVAA